MSQKNLEPTFSRGDVAKILNVTTLTIANREKRGQYPEAKRDINGYRIYTLNDVYNLQLVTFNYIDTRPILSVMYDKGYTSAKTATQIVDAALDRRRGVV